MLQTPALDLGSGADPTFWSKELTDLLGSTHPEALELIQDRLIAQEKTFLQHLSDRGYATVQQEDRLRELVYFRK